MYLKTTNFTLITFKDDHTCPKQLRDHQDGHGPSTEERSPVALSIGQNVVIVIQKDAENE